jgi:hypothetical protein
MGQRWTRFNLSIALAVSLSAHGALVWWMLRDQIDGLVSSLLAGRAAPVLDSTETAVITPPELPPPKNDPFDIDLDLGDWNGTGHAIAKAAGDQPLAGRKAEQDQPLLSRDPVGHGRIGDAPTQYTGPIGHGGEAIEQLREAVADQDPGSPAVAMKYPIEAPVITPAAPKPIAGPGNAAPPQVAAGPTVVASGGGGTTPQQPSKDAPNKSADPAPMSDSEIDLFSRNAVVEFRQGKALPQFGRKATLTRPHIPLVGAIDAFAMGHAVRITLVLKTDEKGQVVNARVAKGSGSNEIDNPVRREAYNWTFDPGDKDHPFPSEFPIVVAIYD